jgi:hypothetical protein
MRFGRLVSFAAGGGPAGGRVIARGGSNPSPFALISPVNATVPLFTLLPRRGIFSENGLQVLPILGNLTGALVGSSCLRSCAVVAVTKVETSYSLELVRVIHFMRSAIVSEEKREA